MVNNLDRILDRILEITKEELQARILRHGAESESNPRKRGPKARKPKPSASPDPDASA